MEEVSGRWECPDRIVDGSPSIPAAAAERIQLPPLPSMGVFDRFALLARGQQALAERGGDSLVELGEKVSVAVEGYVDR